MVKGRFIRRRHALACIVLSWCVASNAYQLDPSISSEQLWLPLSYKQYRFQLHEVASLVKQELPRCHTFVKGELKIRLSTQDKPVYRIACRDSNRKLFWTLVDGPSQEVIDDDFPGGRITFEQLRIEKAKQVELEAMRQAAEQAYLRQQAEAARLAFETQQKEEYWQACQQLVTERTRHMRELEWLTTERPEFAEKAAETLSEASPDEDLDKPHHSQADDLATGATVDAGPGSATDDSSENQTQNLNAINEPASADLAPLVGQYQVDFNAKNLQGTPLRYRALCDFASNSDGEPSVRIIPRRDK